jgi:hypothetical protein
MHHINQRQLNAKFNKLHRQFVELQCFCNGAPPPPKASTDINQKRDVKSRALLALRKATVAQRADIFRQLGAELGPDVALSVLTDLEVTSLNGAASNSRQPPAQDTAG